MGNIQPSACPVALGHGVSAQQGMLKVAYSNTLGRSQPHLWHGGSNGMQTHASKETTPWAGHSLACGMVAAPWDCPLDPWKLTLYIPSLNGEGPSQQVW